MADYMVSKGCLKNLGINLSLNYQDDVFINVADNVKYDPYWMTDLGVSYKLKNNIRLSLMVNNILNVDYCDSSLFSIGFLFILKVCLRRLCIQFTGYSAHC